MNGNCMCSNPDCLANGCLINRRNYSNYPTYPNNPGTTYTAPMQQGWLCPQCKTVHAPFMPTCTNCQPKALDTGISSDLPPAK